jgi:uncharacterized protein YodC (DUF2158 family)
MTDSEQIWVLDWQNLNDLEVIDRVAWLRESLEAGKDWAVCNDPRMCVLKTSSASMLYRMRWFDGTQCSFSPYMPGPLAPYMDDLKEVDKNLAKMKEMLEDRL